MNGWAGPTAPRSLIYNADEIDEIEEIPMTPKTTQSTNPTTNPSNLKDMDPKMNHHWTVERGTDEFRAKLKFYRLNEDEYDRICSLIGREPRGVEWALFSALWSEHCSYKSSKIHLKTLFNRSPRVVESFGENAGVVDLGQGERVAFKIESHNHPSFIEPYQGAATGVGGILRDIFTMGARPIALANYLCFGDPKAPRMSQLVDGVVRGIGGYGNCVGVPTITGQTEFHESYNGNILVNAMAVGLFRPGEKIFLSKARGPGNFVVYVGAKTGRDGVHGASMASESFEADSAKKRPTVQIGDPFFEKLLIESCLEVMSQDLVVAIQDMGAAGLTSSSFEMASKGSVGFKLWLDKVPLRDSSMLPEEILLSESQERMLIVCEPEKFEALAQVFHRWGLDAVKIGEVTEKRSVELWWKGELLTDINPDLLVENAPQYQRAWQALTPTNRVSSRSDLAAVGVGRSDALSALRDSLAHARGASRSFVYRQYDSRVGAATARDCTDSVGVIRLRDSGRALGVVLGCRPHVMRFDAKIGGMDAIAYPALELALKGFETLAVTDCLNFGNPEREQIMSEFVASLAGMNAVCRSLGAPIISGNVSFYNETMGRNITSTPATGLVGLRDNLEKIPLSYFSRQSASPSTLYMLRLPGLVLGGVAQEISLGKIKGMGELDSETVVSFIRVARLLSRAPGVESTRAVGKFGLAYALARMSLSGCGAAVDREGLEMVRGVSDASSLFEEHLYEAIFAVDHSHRIEFEDAFSAIRRDCPIAELHRIGETSNERFQLASWIDTDLDSLRESYTSGWRRNFENLA
jgi:phosphoribosylformylglycinamidine synthase II